MAAIVPRRRELIAYSAGVAVIAGLMAVVALGGNVVTAKKPITELTPSHVTAQNQR
ncbi:MAG: hypothetical protein WD871_10810 [Xanthobacteraceae bacterium]